MKRSTLFTCFVLVGLAISAPQIAAAPSCTDWMHQDNGCDQRVCVDDNGQQYCEELCPGGVAHRVKC